MVDGPGARPHSADAEERRADTGSVHFSGGRRSSIAKRCAPSPAIRYRRPAFRIRWGTGARPSRASRQPTPEDAVGGPRRRVLLLARALRRTEGNAREAAQFAARVLKKHPVKRPGRRLLRAGDEPGPIGRRASIWRSTLEPRPPRPARGAQTLPPPPRSAGCGSEPPGGYNHAIECLRRSKRERGRRTNHASPSRHGGGPRGRGQKQHSPRAKTAAAAGRG